MTEERLLVEVDGATLEVWRHGEATAPTLVFLHEGLGCAALWKETPAELCRALGVGAVVPSRAGYGGSSPVAAAARPLRYLWDEGVTALPALLARLGLDDVVLIGHSDGASIALAYAAGAPPGVRLRGLVVMAPHTFVEDVALHSIRAAREAYLAGPLRARLARYHGDNVDGAFWGWNGMWLDPAFRVAELDAALPRVTAPVLAIQGRRDEYGTLRQLDVLAERCAGPFERLVLEDCGHSPHRDQPALTHAAIARFVAALVP